MTPLDALDEPIKRFQDLLRILRLERQLATLETLTREALTLSDDALDDKIQEIARVLGIPESEWYAMDETVDG